jgi:hypothetical protein
MSRYALRSTLAALTLAVTAGLISPSIAAPDGDASPSAEGRSHRGVIIAIMNKCPVAA